MPVAMCSRPGSAATYHVVASVTNMQRSRVFPESMPLRIAFCTDSLPPVVDGVTGTLQELVPTLLESGVEFLFVSAVQPDRAWPWHDRVHQVRNVRFPLY